MNLDPVRDIADAVLYEGYILYPYRPSSVKNRQRWTFGGVFPREYRGESGDACVMQTQLLLDVGADAAIDLHLRFLQVQTREIGKLLAPIAALPADHEPEFAAVASIEVDGERLLAWEEAIERDVVAPDLALHDLLDRPRRIEFAREAKRELEPVRNAAGEILGVVIRTSLPLQGVIIVSAEEIKSAARGLLRLTVRVENTTALSEASRSDRDKAQQQAFVSTHTIFSIRGGGFVSLLDPPEALREAAAACENIGTWPVLIGTDGANDIMLSSPIILYDFPKIAPESPGELFDGTEIDEILTLRVLTLTEEEKREMAAADPRSRALLERCEALTPEQLGKLHGSLRNLTSAENPLEPLVLRDQARPYLASLSSNGRHLAVGDHVRLNPRKGGDIMDLALKDKVAVIEGIERDFEDRLHVVVTLLDDPGRDLGAAGFPGHRFFFSQEELEPVGGEDRP
ncbi:hypothetical protein RZS28_06270 [Methylocapsa polymorpha]|uniref:Uncharacterized protein n=1 Tax=Methylocapsa polymorpha TaxID=3080828 RepID=A0ABZ0HYD8_9HYPH|nr:hypothetical protein RZS28_06270 [Methylocapsa sp. RX1]